MTFGFPAAFWFAMLAIPVVAAFFYRRRAIERIVPALEAWESLGTPVSSKSISSLLRRLLSLLAQLLLLTLLVIALADPSPTNKVAGRTIIVLDVSATLQTREGNAVRMAAAKDAALRCLSDLPPDAEVVVLRAAHTPILAQALTKSITDARKAIEATESLDIDGDLPRGVEAARAFVDRRAKCDVVVISDFAGADPAALSRNWTDSAQLRLIRVGESSPDLAITGFWAEQRGSDRRIVARISQLGMTGRVVPVRLSINGQLAERRLITLAERPAPVEFTAPMPPRAIYEVMIESGDALALDDRAVGIVPATELHGVCLVTRGNPPLERALLSDPSVRLRVVTPGAYTGPLDDGVVIVDGPGLGHRAPDNAAYLFIGTADPFGWAVALDSVAGKPISHWTGDHRSLTDVDPTLFRVNKLLKMRWNPGFTAAELIGADDLPVAVEVTGTSGAGAPDARHLFWLFSVGDSDLPRRLTFPLLLWNTVDYLASGGQDLAPDASKTGHPLRVAPISDHPPTVTDPANHPVECKPNAAGWLVSETYRQGVYRRTDTGEAFAVNWLSSRGTFALPTNNDSFSSLDAESSARPSVTPSFWSRLRKKLSWRLMLLAAAMFAAVEWALFNRRIIRIG